MHGIIAWFTRNGVAANLLMFVLIITIPFGFAAWRLAGYALWPFGRVVVPQPDAGAPSCVGNVLWFFLAGVWLALLHLVTGVALCITIIGIPFGIANFKLAGLALNPLGKEIVDADDLARLAPGTTYYGMPSQ